MRKRQMMNNNELKAKITGWILEEGATYAEFRDENADFRIRVTWGYDIDVIKDRPNSILCYSSWTFQDVDSAKALAKLTKAKKREFFYELEAGLTHFITSNDIEPESHETLDSMHFYRRLYLEDLTKTSFFDSLSLMNRVKNFTRLLIINKLNLDEDNSQFPEEKAGVA